MRPDISGADVDFSVTVQDVTGTKTTDKYTKHFTYPVRQVWCEITPIAGDAPRTAQLPDQIVVKLFGQLDDTINIKVLACFLSCSHRHATSLLAIT